MRIQKGTIVKVDLAPSSKKEGFLCIFLEEKSDQVVKWLKAYAAKKQPKGDLPLAPVSAPFHFKALKELQKIPLGGTSSYKSVAEKLGKPGASRAVGNACRVNPFPLFVPCHRVLASDGSLGGFAYGLLMKKEMLAFEREQEV